MQPSIRIIDGIHKVKHALFASVTLPEKPNVLAMKTYLKRVKGPATLEIKSEIKVTDNRQIEDTIKYLTNAGIDIDSL